MKEKRKSKKLRKRKIPTFVKEMGKKKTRAERAAGRLMKKKVVRKNKGKIIKKIVKKRAFQRSQDRARAKVRGFIGNSIRGPLYTLNANFEFFNELRNLVLKSSPAEKDRMIARLNRLGRVKLAIISGVFINKENLDPLVSDLLIVGDDINRRKLRAFLKATEAEVGKEIKFTLMDKEEFQYRLAMFDRFVRVLLESPHEKLINRLGL
jgi:hypothetical protein